MDDKLLQLVALGREHYRAAQYDKAEPYLAKALEEHRGFADVHNMLGVIFHDQGRFAEAEESFEEALSINPNYTEAALNLAVIYNDRGKYDQARELYGRVLNYSHSQPRALDPFAKGKLANLHAELGTAYAQMAMFHEAVREFETALELCPSFVDLRTQLGNVYREMGKTEDSIRQYRRAKQQSPGYLSARLSLGLALYSSGDKQAAATEWREILDRDPENRRAAAYLRMVESAQPA